MFNKKEADVTFISTIPGLTQLEDCIPKPTSKYTPDWWKSLKIDEVKKSAYDLYTGNIKHCPSFCRCIFNWICCSNVDGSIYWI